MLEMQENYVSNSSKMPNRILNMSKIGHEHVTNSPTVTNQLLNQTVTRPVQI